MNVRRALARLAGGRRREPASTPASPSDPATEKPDENDFAAHAPSEARPGDLSITFTMVDRPRDES
jgi:hypothetical protein